MKFTTHPDLYPFLNEEYNRLRAIVKGEVPSDDPKRDARLFFALQQQLKGVDVVVEHYRERIIRYLEACGGRATQRQIQMALEPHDAMKQKAIGTDIQAGIDAKKLWRSGVGGKKDPKVISLEFDPLIHKKPKR